MSLSPGQFNTSDRFVGRTIAKDSLDRLPNDVLLDIFLYLDVYDILRLRKLNKLYYELTHVTWIWKHLLRTTDVELPPLPPTTRNSVSSMSGLEAERLLKRALSLDANWKSNNPSTFREWSFDAHYHILEMQQLPGGQYVVASVTDPGEQKYSLVVYTMDTLGSARAVAAIDTVTKAYSLQAKYMTVRGIPSIVIAFLRRDYHHKSDRRRVAKGHLMDASQFSTRHAIDAEFRYECAVMHVPLENLEYLGDIKHPTDSKLFREAAAELPRPFKALVSVVSTKNLRSPVLAEMFGAGYLALAKSDNDVVFKRIDGGAAATLTCIDQPTVAQSRHYIRAIQLLPQENAVLVVREIDTRRRRGAMTYVIEKFPALRCGERPKFQQLNSTDHTVSRDLGTLSDFYIPEVPLARRPVQGGDPEPPLPLCVYAHKAGEEKLVRFLFQPKRVFLPPQDKHPVSLTSHQPPIAYRYSLGASWTTSWRARDPNVKLAVIPAHRRPLLYSYDWEDLSDAPLVLHVQPWIDHGWDVPGPRAIVDDVVRHPCSMALIGSLPFGQERCKGPNDLCKRVAAFGWDESIGRLLVAETGTSVVTVYDFADAPMQDENGERCPVPLRDIPNPDVPVVPCERPEWTRGYVPKKERLSRRELRTLAFGGYRSSTRTTSHTM